MSEIFPPEIAALLVKPGRGRPAGSDKERVTLRVDKVVLDHFRAASAGWQTRINDALRKVAGA